MATRAIYRTVETGTTMFGRVYRIAKSGKSKYRVQVYKKEDAKISGGVKINPKAKAVKTYYVDKKPQWIR